MNVPPICHLQVNAALQGQPMSVAVRQATQSPVRIQTSAGGTPLVAVTVQQPAGVQSQGIPTVVTAQQVLTPPQQLQQQHAVAIPVTQSGSSQEAVRHKVLYHDSLYVLLITTLCI
jgi:fructoselysine-6-P-deglycase FrlB-like protein